MSCILQISILQHREVMQWLKIIQLIKRYRQESSSISVIPMPMCFVLFLSHYARLFLMTRLFWDMLNLRGLWDSRKEKTRKAQTLRRELLHGGRDWAGVE